MAYSGYLLKIGSSEIPFKYIMFDSYNITPNTRTDQDPIRNANNNLIRNVLTHTLTSITFNTRPMGLADMQAFMLLIKSNLTNDLEKKCSLTYYDMENDTYNTDYFYIPDIKWSIQRADADSVWYNSTEISFIEY